ncbi:MAG: hypothetical protein Q4F33_04160 [Mycoplasmatota bacterium]|nr:hypothetical protein [Mycoplasmatota bacterium]
MNKYDDIINFERPNSLIRTKASRENRAAQFAPFSALASYEDVLEEIRRITVEKKVLADNYQEMINNRLNFIKKHIKEQFVISISHFIKDENKDGGLVKISVGCIRKIDEVKRIVVLTTGEKIMIDDIENIIGDVFDLLEV